MGIQVKLSRTAMGTLFALALTLPVAAQSGHTGALDSIHIANFGRVNATYYRGAQPGGHDYADLAALGVKTVIDLQLDADRSEAGMVKAAGMTYVNIGMTTSVAPTPAQIEQFLHLVNDPASQPVYVHCAGGRHRTGVMTAVYRMSDEGWTSDKAFKEMKQYNFGPDFLHPEFKRFVYAYHAQAPAAPQVVIATETPVLSVPVAATATK
jgi:protein tyrosine/serine phosphatase